MLNDPSQNPQPSQSWPSSSSYVSYPSTSAPRRSTSFQNLMKTSSTPQDQSSRKKQQLASLQYSCPLFWEAYKSGEVSKASAYLKSYNLNTTKLTHLAALKNLSPHVQEIGLRVADQFPLFWQALTSGELRSAFQLIREMKSARRMPMRMPTPTFSQTANLANLRTPMKFENFQENLVNAINRTQQITSYDLEGLQKPPSLHTN